MRSKEDSQDYRYFPDPDLLPLAISPEWIAEVKATMPELPAVKRTRFMTELGLSDYDALVLTQSKAFAMYFEAVVQHAGAAHAKSAANWMMGDVASTLNREGIDISAIPVTAQQLGQLILRIADGTVSNKMAKEVFAAMWQTPSSNVNLADAVIESKGLKQISDPNALEKIINEVLAGNPKSVEEFRAGKEKAFNALVGQAMKATKGKANPAQVNALLLAKLNS